MLRIIDARTGEPVHAAPARRGLTRVEVHAPGSDPTNLRVLLVADLLVRALELGGTPVWALLTGGSRQAELRADATALGIRPFEDSPDVSAGLGEAQVVHVAAEGGAAPDGARIAVAPVEETEPGTPRGERREAGTSDAVSGELGLPVGGAAESGRPSGQSAESGLRGGESADSILPVGESAESGPPSDKSSEPSPPSGRPAEADPLADKSSESDPANGQSVGRGTLGGVDPTVLRLALLTRHHDAPVRLDAGVLEEAGATLARWRGAVARWARRPSRPVPDDVRRRLRGAWEDDLDVPRVLDELRRVENEPELPDGARFETYAYADRLLGLELTRDLGAPS
ncbi:hypothetical protein [Streptomyces swartbergensis]|uniref:hypothetical protein n=1 Tax=Streptomyces swartbergensis TaxID=487165 RepID=UPI001ABFE970|nr:hypothetical protein [Streptomyces swartbergensis]